MSKSYKSNQLGGINQFVDKERERLQSLVYDVIIGTHDKMYDRIFEEHKDAKGNSPKPYSTKPLWFLRSELPREAGEKTKGGKGVTRRFDGGYEQLKREIGRPPLELNRFLKSDFPNALKQVGEFEFHVILEKKNYDKMMGNFKEFPKLSEDEREYLIKGLSGIS